MVGVKGEVSVKRFPLTSCILPESGHSLQSLDSTSINCFLFFSKGGTYTYMPYMFRFLFKNAS